jgi:2-polyprenyl-3-methyl-5-hydroxy-6-metoxy-1,4-benzoquinol methylase
MQSTLENTLPQFDFSFTHEQYQDLFNPNREGGYPGNHVAYRHALNVLHERKANRLLEVGVGSGLAIPVFSGAGMEFFGFDNNPEMVAKSKMEMQKYGLPDDHVVWGDIEDSISLSPIRNSGQFDGLVAMGVLPHVTHERAALRNMWHLVKPGGTIFVECRNKLFSLVTFNRFTYEFILDDLLMGVDPAVRDATAAFLKTRLDTDMPPTPSRCRTRNPAIVLLVKSFDSLPEATMNYSTVKPRDNTQTAVPKYLWPLCPFPALYILFLFHPLAKLSRRFERSLAYSGCVYPVFREAR